MARYVLLAQTVVGANSLRAGTILDSVQDSAAVTHLLANARWLLAPLPNAILEEAAALASKRALSGASDAELAGIMQSSAATDAARGVTGTEIAQTDWWIDRRFGDDGNDGLTRGTALRTHAEFKRRVGDNPLVTQEIVVHVLYLQDGPTIETIDMEATFYGPDAVLVYRGELSEPDNPAAHGDVVSFTDGSYAPGPNGTEPSITVTKALGSSGLNDNIGNLIVFDRGGPNEAATFCSYSLSPGTTGRVNRGHRRKAGAGPRKFEGVAPQASETWESYGVPVAAQMTLVAHRLRTESTGVFSSTENATFIVERMAVGTPQASVPGRIHATWDGDTVNADAEASPVFLNCLIAGLVEDTRAAFVGCTFGTSSSGTGTAEFRGGHVQMAGQAGGQPIFKGCVVEGIITFGGPSYFDGAAGPRFLEGSRAGGSGGFGGAVYVTSGPGIDVDHTSDLDLSQVWGATTGVDVDSFALRVNGRGWYSSGILPRIAKGSTANDTEIGGVGVDYGSLPHVTAANNAMLVVRP